MKRIFTTLFIFLTCHILWGQIVPSVDIDGESYNTISEAILNAVDGDVISIRGEHTLTSTLVVNKNITLSGTSNEEDIISGDNLYRVINATGDNVMIENLTITKGYSSAAHGGAIYAFDIEHLTLNNVNVTDSFSGKNGGGIAIGGSDLTMNNCLVEGNTSENANNGIGGGLFVIGRNTGAVGRTVSIKNSLFNNNSVDKNGGGIGFDPNGIAYHVDFDIENTTISNNIAATEGGGIYVKSITSSVDVNLPVVSMKLNHVTMMKNSATSGTRNGIYYYKGGTHLPGILKIYNSIIALNALDGGHDINFGLTNTQNLVNTLLGTVTNKNGTNVAEEINVVTGENAVSLGLSSDLETVEGSFNKIFLISSSSTAKDFSDGTYEKILTDATGQTRDEFPDAGAYEFTPPPFDPINTVINTSTGVQYYSIQEAIDAASSEEIITINGEHFENLSINKSLTLQGDDANEDILSAVADQSINEGRVITITGGDVVVNLKHFTVQNGNTAEQGGGIKATNITGEVVLDHMVVKNNTSVKHGGGIASMGADMTIQFTTIEGNITTSTGEQFGGGVFVSPNNTNGANTTVNIQSSTLNNNSNGKFGGAIGIDGRWQFEYTATVTLENTTIFGNTATSGGGAIYARTNDLDGFGNIFLAINHSTIAHNVSGNNTGVVFKGFGSLPVNFSLSNSIISSNGEDTFTDINFTDAVSVISNSFLGHVVSLPTEDITNSLDLGHQNYDLQLANALSDEGGIVEVLAIGGRSAALDHAIGSTLANDAVGGTRNDEADAGAFEGIKEAFDPINTVINTSTGVQYYSIQEAIDAVSSEEIITINGEHFENLLINKSLTLQGDDANEDILSAVADQSINEGRVITITGGDVFVNLKHFTVQNGNTAEQGGGIKATNITGEVVLDHMVVKNNTSVKHGGGIASMGADMTIQFTTIEGNTTTSTGEQFGGGVFVSSNNTNGANTTVNIQSSTLNNNSNEKLGGAIGIDGRWQFEYTATVTLENTTIFGNTATSGGGAIYARTNDLDGLGNISLAINHSTIAHNVSGNNTGVLFKKIGSLPVNFSLSNSIISSNGEDTFTDINFTDAVSVISNSFLGHVVSLPTEDITNFLDLGHQNYDLQLASTLSDEGGIVKVLAIGGRSVALDHAIGSTLVNDAVGGTRNDEADAGAFEGIKEAFDPINTVINTSTGVQYYSIQEAIDAASSEEIITINGEHFENLLINKSLTLQGNDANEDILSAVADQSINEGRVITITGGDVDVNLKHFTVQNGNTAEQGGGIKATNITGEVVLDHMVVKNNTSVKHGGGIASMGADMTIQFTTIEGNTTTSTGEQFGGGVFVSSNNTNGANTTVNIQSSTLNNNSNGKFGGAIGIDGRWQFEYTATVTLENTTIFGNTATSGGGAIYARTNDLDGFGNIFLAINHSTIAHNVSGNNTGVVFKGFGSLPVNFSLSNSIISSNGEDTFTDINFTDAVSVISNSFLGHVVSLPTEDITNSLDLGHQNYDLQLANALSDEGGIVKVLAIGDESYALDFAINSTLQNDAIGQERIGEADAGAFEKGEYIFDDNKTVMMNDKRYRGINDALSFANAGDIIHITGVHTETLTINKEVTIMGEDPTQDIIQAAEDSTLAITRVIEIRAENVTLENIGVRNGNTIDNGAGVYIYDTKNITLKNVEVYNNRAFKIGAGIFVFGSSNVILDQLNVFENHATGNGGGLAMMSRNGALQNTNGVVENSSIHHNLSDTNGGGVVMDGNGNYGNNYSLDFDFLNTTIAFNVAREGGAIMVKGAPLSATPEIANVSVNMNHMTVAYNDVSGETASRRGFQFIGNTDTEAYPTFTLANSIVSLNGTDVQNDINFYQSNTVSVINSLIGSMNNTDYVTLFENTFSGMYQYDLELSTELSENNILTIGATSTAQDFGYDSGETTYDALGTIRIKPDIGAFEAVQHDYSLSKAILNEIEYPTAKQAYLDAIDNEKITLIGTHTYSLLIKKSVELEGQEGTILQAANTVEEASSRVLSISGVNTSVTISDLIIQNGYAIENHGGGIYVDLIKNITLENVLVRNNKADLTSGGIYIGATNTLLVNSEITNNYAVGNAGGVQYMPKNSGGENKNIIIRNTLISHNTTESIGGGLVVESNNNYANNFINTITLENTTIAFNTANESGGAFIKGALYTHGETSNINAEFIHTTVAYNTVTGENSSKYGVAFGGLDAGKPVVSLKNALITNNGSNSQIDINFINSNTVLVDGTILGKVVNQEGNVEEYINSIDNTFDAVQLSAELELVEGTRVLTLGEGSLAQNFSINEYLTHDASGFERENPDAGASESQHEVNTDNVVRNGERFYTSIALAYNEAIKNDTIYITGTFNESLILRKGITIIGEGEAIIQAAESKELAESRVITTLTSQDTIALANLTLRNGFSENDNGGAVKVENAYGLFSLENVVIENSSSAKNGGAISFGGGNMALNKTWIRNNTSTLNGGGLHIFSRNATGQDSKIMIEGSLIQNNESLASGGGLVVDGNNGFGNNFTTQLEIQNTTITGNQAKETGALFIKGAKNEDSTNTNIEVLLNHVVIVKNNAVGSRKGISFAGVDVAKPIFNCYNSIISLNGEDDETDINFVNSATQNLKFNAFGKVYQMAGNSEVVENTMINKFGSHLLLSEELVAFDGILPIFTHDGGSAALDAAGGENALPIDITGYERINPDLGLYEYRNLVWKGTLNSDVTLAGNWNENRVPAIDELVYIPKTVVSPFEVTEKNVTVGNILIQEGVIVNVSNDYTLIVDGNIEASNGRIVLSDGGGLLVRGTNEGVQEIQNENKLIGVPIENSTVDSVHFYHSFAPQLLPSSNLNDAFEPLSVDQHSLYAGIGYLRQDNQNSLSFRGETNQKDLTIKVSSLFEEGNTISGINVIANPFTTYLSYEDLMLVNEGNLGAIYRWEDTQKGDLQTVTRLGVVGNNVNTWDRGFKVGEGFFAQVKEEELYFTTDMRIENIRTHRLSQKEEEDFSKVKVHLKSANGLSNETLIGFGEIGTTTFDWGYDAYKQGGNNGLSIYSKLDTEAMSIQLLGSIENTIEVPLYLNIEEQEEYSLSFDYLLDEGFKLFIKDHSTHRITTINEGDVYTFISDIVTDEHRFDLIVSKDEIISSIAPLDKVNIIVKPHEILLNGLSPISHQVSIYNTLGAALYSLELDRKSSFYSIPFTFKKHQVYIINITSSEGNLIKKVVF